LDIEREYEINPSLFGGTAQGVTTNSNVLLTAASPGNLAVALNTQRNSLTIEGGAGLAIADGVQFSLRSGGILVRPGSTSVITGGVINQVAASTAALHIWAFGDLTLSSALAGGNGIGNGSPSLIKAGSGTLTIAPPTSAVNGLNGLGVNTLSGLFMLNQGTVKLGSLNAIQANNYFAAIGGTLDLNGNSQLFFGSFTESTITNQGTTITSTGGPWLSMKRPLRVFTPRPLSPLTADVGGAIVSVPDPALMSDGLPLPIPLPPARAEESVRSPKAQMWRAAVLAAT